ncbi:MAG: hypothetical protein LAT84_06760 [Balneolia bacterium]|nr:hypothetical protein [Balneolia bacterium]
MEISQFNHTFKVLSNMCDSKSLMRFRLLMICFCTVALIAGCGGNSDDNLATGSFSAEISGAIDHSFGGISAYGVQQIGPPVGNIFVLTNNSTGSGPVFAVNLSMQTESLPGTGTHQIGADGSTSGAQFIRYSGNNEDMLHFGSVSGQMTINRTSSERIEGEFNFTGKNSEQQEVNVSVRFNARCIQAPSVSCN